MRAFPNDPGRRRVILVLRARDYEACEFSREGAALLGDHEAYVLELDRAEDSDSPVLRSLRSHGQLAPGAILIQSPFALDEYVALGHAALSLARTKHMLFSTLCRWLGASEVQVKTLEAKRRRVTVEGKASVGVGGYGGDLAVDQEASDALKAEMHLHDVFVGGEADVAQAEQFLREHHLDQDIELRSLVDMRRGIRNPLRERALSISLSKEAQSRMHVAARCFVPQGIGVDATLKRHIEETYEYTEEVVVRFR